MASIVIRALHLSTWLPGNPKTMKKNMGFDEQESFYLSCTWLYPNDGCHHPQSGEPTDWSTVLKHMHSRSGFPQIWVASTSSSSRERHTEIVVRLRNMEDAFSCLSVCFGIFLQNSVISHTLHSGNLAHTFSTASLLNFYPIRTVPLFLWLEKHSVAKDSILNIHISLFTSMITSRLDFWISTSVLFRVR